MREEALRLAGLGLRVFPLKGKTPIVAGGCLSATTEAVQIESWWERFPKANIGIAPGNGIVILDVDTPDTHGGGTRDGREALRGYVHQHGAKWLKTVSARTGSGRHFYFGVPRGVQVKNAKDNALGVGLELLSQGRYAVAPPSIHPITKKPYEWLVPPEGDGWKAIPEWLIEKAEEARALEGGSQWDRDLQEIHEGEGRDNHLTSFAGSLRRSGSPAEEILAALEARNNRVCRPPLPLKDLRRIAKSVSRYKPEDLMVRARPDDVGNGERLAHFAEGRILHVEGVGWHTWTGKRWRKGTGPVLELAQQCSREILQAATDVKHEEISKRLAAWGAQSANITRLNAMVSLAATKRGIACMASQLDGQPHVLNMQNGTFDLYERELRSHRGKDRFTRITRVDYDPEIECPKWEKFLGEILPNGEIRQYIQRAVGYSLCGNVDEQCFFLLYGTGSNGKSTFIETITYMLGNYAAKMSTATVMAGKRQAGAPSPDVVRLRGPRFVVAAETGGDAAFNEAMIKDLTGKDTLTARALFKDEIEFVPQFKLWIYANYKPTIRGMDYGIWRRIRLIPFTATIRKPDKTLPAKLHTETAGIFNWALRGYYEWEKYGLREPKAITQEVEGYQEMMDVVKQFITEVCVVGKEETEAAVELWEAFGRWQRDLPYNEKLRRGRFFDRLIGLGFPHIRTRVRGARFQVSAYKGLRIRTNS